jgi:haloacid dehalogenase superfamily, subfamily IA, variant 3 with third motif having DD or ED/haloacid dehalogenase superfamily, subfamily IA, variant 1 with third motif having Dx(3-4)D or Dx(3-4)E
VTKTKAVFLDALGTLVELEPPWVGLRAALGDGIPEAQLVSGVRAEMAYYKAHSHEGRDPESLADLRRRSAELLSRELGTEVSVETLVESIRFAPYPDAVPALTQLRSRGLKLVCVSNWDCSLGEVLERCGLAAHLDGAVSSAEAGARKPDPAIFEAALALAGCSADEAVHVGDTREEDVEGAEAAGIRALLLDREGVGDIAGLEEVAQQL